MTACVVPGLFWTAMIMCFDLDMTMCSVHNNVLWTLIKFLTTCAVPGMFRTAITMSSVQWLNFDSLFCSWAVLHSHNNVLWTLIKFWQLVQFLGCFWTAMIMCAIILSESFYNVGVSRPLILVMNILQSFLVINGFFSLKKWSDLIIGVFCTTNWTFFCPFFIFLEPLKNYIVIFTLIMSKIWSQILFTI